MSPLTVRDRFYKIMKGFKAVSGRRKVVEAELIKDAIKSKELSWVKLGSDKQATVNKDDPITHP